MSKLWESQIMKKDDREFFQPLNLRGEFSRGAQNFLKNLKKIFKKKKQKK